MTIAFSSPPGVVPNRISFGGLVKAMVIAAEAAMQWAQWARLGLRPALQ